MSKMPRGDGTGQSVKGLETGSRKGPFKGSRGVRFTAGPGGYCVCPNCGYKVSHQIGTPCYQQHCPKCKTAMTRE